MFYNNVLEKFLLPAGDKLLNTNFIKELHWWREVAKLSPSQIQSLQQERLFKLLKHATSSIPYYKKFNISLCEDPYESLKKFPLLTKYSIRDNASEILVSSAEKLIIEKSSGSSGLQTQVYMSKKENAQSQAALIFLWEKSGYKLGDKILQTGITPNRGFIKSVKDFILRTTYVNAYDLSEENLCKYLYKAKKENHQFLAGFAASLNAFAKVALANNIKVNFKAIISWGDKLFDHYKANIIQAFNNPFITELYGSAEGFVISGSCVYGNHHVMSPHVYLEILDKNGNPAKPEELGFVIVTRLDAYHFPLIRYYLGDLAIQGNANETCKCGSNFPFIKKIIGRDTDVVQTPSGKDLIVHFFTGTFEHFQQIMQYRILQKEFGKIEIEYIPAASFSNDVLSYIEKIMFQKANEVFSVEWRQVNEIAPTKSGKPQIIQNLIAQRPANFIDASL